MAGLFITGTGTGLGKTLVAACLVQAALGRGLTVNALKPVLSGYEDDEAAESDAGILLRARGLPVDAAGLDATTPWRYRAPLSPDMAAAREGRAIDVDAVIDFCRAGLSGPQDLVLIEGAGGLMVPLDETRHSRDWIAALGIPVVLVAGTYLGTISHTLTSLAALREAGIPLHAIVLSRSEESPVPNAEVAAAIQRFAPGSRIHALERLSGPEPWRGGADLGAVLDGLA
ncbi:dethiobiotin synthase [Zavarzinia sp. CC-PAN008]|uniref:dethiobiotin synthase n=1 Tax=Zavarzinia sp. CC-PAN008 TaxID=3243332 RepID=UPI003F749DC6